MPQPQRTTLPDAVGYIQPFPFAHAMKECRELNHVDMYYIYNEDVKELQRIVIHPSAFKKAEELYLGGVRIVYHKGIIYTALSMSSDKHNHDTPEKAYDRAMGIVGKR